MPGPSRRAAAVNAYLPSPWTFEPLPHAATAVELNKSAALQLHTPLAHSLVPGVGVAATDMPNHASALALPTPGDQPPHSPDGYRIASAATDWASSGSSMALCTPSTGSSPALSAGPPFSNPGLQGFGTPWGAGGLYSQMATQNGSDSMEWTAKVRIDTERTFTYIIPCLTANSSGDDKRQNGERRRPRQMESAHGKGRQMKTTTCRLVLASAASSESSTGGRRLPSPPRKSAAPGAECWKTR